MKQLSLRCSLGAVLGAAIQAFGMYHIHAQSAITEGGILGFTLLFHHLFGLSPALSGFLLTALCYVMGWKLLGKEFLWYSALSAAGFSLFYRVFSFFAPLFPQIGYYPAAAAILGGCFIGIGAGITVRCGGATTGDDALAMSLSQQFHWDIRLIYLCSDLTVLLLSLCYIPLQRIIWSVLTVLISGQLIGHLQKIPRKSC